jgi:hypothetical protein
MRLVASTLIILTLAVLATMAQAPPAQAPAQGRGGAQAPPPPPAPQPGHPSGKLVIWGDLSLFERPPHPDTCILTNRFKRGQRVGFRMTAIDGGSGEVENTAVLTAHINYAGQTIDVPMRWRGVGNVPPGYLRPTTNTWTGAWVVPMDATTGKFSYTVTATDRFGRTANFLPFSYENSQLTIVE